MIISNNLSQSTNGRRQIVVRRLLTAAQAGSQSALEGVSKVAVEQCVNERIERRVDISDPEQNGDDKRRRLRTQFTAQRVIDVPLYYNVPQRLVDVPREEWQPTAQKRTHDDAECLGCLVLTSHLATFRSLLLHADVCQTTQSPRRRHRRRRCCSLAQCYTAAVAR